MLILLSDGAGLTSRQVATVLARAGHRVEELSPRGLRLGRMTRHVRRVHDVPPVGREPHRWLDAALDVAARRGADLLLPVQEQVAVMALGRDRIEAAGLATAVPSFEALAQVQDKVSAYRTLARLGVPQPPAVIAASAAELAEATRLPVFVKTPIGTASAGVRRVSSREELGRLAGEYERLGVFAGGGGAGGGGAGGGGAGGGGAGGGGAGGGGVLVQQPVAGPLVMVQAVFADGELVAFHACERVREGTAGGASHKRGRPLPRAREQMARLGAALTWHGALSADVIDGPEGPVFIDINPRLVEPANALASGVDLTGALVQVALTGTSRPQPDGAPGARTHQLLLAVLGTAQRGRRRDVARELADAALRRGSYRDSREELTPVRGDLLAPVPVAVAALATLAWPPAWRRFVGGSAGAYALTPAAWAELTRTARERIAAPS
jgi:biotin carboxylase